MEMEVTWQLTQETSEARGKQVLLRTLWWQKPARPSELYQQQTTHTFGQNFLFQTTLPIPYATVNIESKKPKLFFSKHEYLARS